MPSPTLQPMTLANMRENGVRALMVWCVACNHHADVVVDALPDDLQVPTLAGRFRCSACGSRRVQARPAWHTRADTPTR